MDPGLEDGADQLTLPEVLAQDLELSKSVFLSKRMTAGAPVPLLAAGDAASERRLSLLSTRTTITTNITARAPATLAAPPTPTTPSFATSPHPPPCDGKLVRIGALGAMPQTATAPGATSARSHLDFQQQPCPLEIQEDDGSDSSSLYSSGLEPPSVRFRKESVLTAATSVNSAGPYSTSWEKQQQQQQVGRASKERNMEDSWVDLEPDMAPEMEARPHYGHRNDAPPPRRRHQPSTSTQQTTESQDNWRMSAGSEAAFAGLSYPGYAVTGHATISAAEASSRTRSLASRSFSDQLAALAAEHDLSPSVPKRRSSLSYRRAKSRSENLGASPALSTSELATFHAHVSASQIPGAEYSRGREETPLDEPDSLPYSSASIHHRHRHNHHRNPSPFEEGTPEPKSRMRGKEHQPHTKAAEPSIRGTPYERLGSPVQPGVENWLESSAHTTSSPRHYASTSNGNHHQSARRGDHVFPHNHHHHPLHAALTSHPPTPHLLHHHHQPPLHPPDRSGSLDDTTTTTQPHLLTSTMPPRGPPLPPEVVETLRVSVACFPETMLLCSSLTVENVRAYSRKLRRHRDAASNVDAADLLERALASPDLPSAAAAASTSLLPLSPSAMSSARAGGGGPSGSAQGLDAAASTARTSSLTGMSRWKWTAVLSARRPPTPPKVNWKGGGSSSGKSPAVPGEPTTAAFGGASSPLSPTANFAMGPTTTSVTNNSSNNRNGSFSASGYTALPTTAGSGSGGLPNAQAPQWQSIRAVFPQGSDYLCDALYAHVLAYNYVAKAVPKRRPSEIAGGVDRPQTGGGGGGGVGGADSDNESIRELDDMVGSATAHYQQQHHHNQGHGNKIPRKAASLLGLPDPAADSAAFDAAAAAAAAHGPPPPRKSFSQLGHYGHHRRRPTDPAASSFAASAGTLASPRSLGGAAPQTAGSDGQNSSASASPAAATAAAAAAAATSNTLRELEVGLARCIARLVQVLKKGPLSDAQEVALLSSDGDDLGPGQAMLQPQQQQQQQQPQGSAFDPDAFLVRAICEIVRCCEEGSA